ncbi:NUDIX hydrolase [Pseudonocardia sp. H11422]|uniref:NUDIX hydrolase n=1 Tax=Pseudonocardia sp. H11422 TaxID=2835866 RepID=UPI001BDD903D|nr:NUDIX hydrolase [Pseudonocardia sp. H11422]
MLDPTRLPEKSQAHVRAWLDGGGTPATPRDAAAIVLLRRGPVEITGGIEVFFLHRHAAMEFAASVAVFPGGGVDARDADAARLGERWAGPPPEAWAERLGVEPEAARGAVCAAIRETFEETGVLLAGDTAGSLVASTAGEDWERDRHRVESREISLTELIESRDLVLRTDLVAPWSVWVTPVFEPRRYRTFFFVAELPGGQETRDVSSESEAVAWTSVREALLGAHPLLPPQLCTCLEIADDATPTEVLRRAASRTAPWVLPEPVVDDDRVALGLPAELAALAERVARSLDA